MNVYVGWREGGKSEGGEAVKSSMMQEGEVAGIMLMMSSIQKTFR